MATDMMILKLMEAFRCAIRQEHFEASEEEWSKLLKLASHHQMENLLWYTAQNSTNVPEYVLQMLQSAHTQAVFYDTQFSCVADAIHQNLTAKNVEHILLRGMVQRLDYPSTDMRLMGDIDYLIHPEDLPVIRTEMETLGGTHARTDEGHYSFNFFPCTYVEFHPSLISPLLPLGSTLNPGWQFLQPGTDLLSEEGFYLNQVIHLAGHLVSGGMGIRQVLDNWVYRTYHTPQPDRSMVENELSKAGLLEFCWNLESLANHWFDGAPASPVVQELGEYIISSGFHGNMNYVALGDAVFSKGKSHAILKRLFPPKKELTLRFPWLKKAPVLLPVAWSIKLVQGLRKHGAFALDWASSVSAVDAKEIQEFREKLKRFGLM